MNGSSFITSLVGVFAALITVAIIAELVSGKAQTANVITATFSGFANVLKAAVAPVS